MKTRFSTGRKLALAMILALVGFVACKKEATDELTPQEEQEVAQASTQSEGETDATFNSVFDDVMGVNNEVGLAGTGIHGGRTGTAGLTDGVDNGRFMQVDSLAPSCVVITVTRLAAASPFPVRITMDFGAGCTGRDGRVRRGKIISTYTGRLINPGSSATTTFDNYFIDSIRVEGTHMITNTTPPPTNTTTQPVRQFTINITNGKLTRPNGNYSLWTGTRVITQVEGLGTPLIALDDVFTIQGQGSGTVKRGTLITRWESNILVPLRKRFACRWIVSGKIRVARSGLASNSPYVTTLDFGTGNCDNLATLTVNGLTFNITLR